MEKKTLKWWQVLGMGLLYVALVLAASFLGFVHPVCWAYFTVLAALLAVWPYYWLAARWQKFGVGTFLALMLLLFCVATGEAKGLQSRSILLVGGVVADLVRLWIGNGSRKSLSAAYPFLAIGSIGWIVRLWATPEWYVEGALDEMGQTYADGIAKLQAPGHLVSAILLTAAVAVLAVWLCGKVDRKSTELLK